MADEYTTLTIVKARLGIADSTDDTVVQQCSDAANDWMLHYIGWYVGPVSSTTRTFDVPSRSRKLVIPIGVRDITLFEVASESGGAYTTIASTDYFLRPASWNNVPGGPYMEVWFSDNPAGTFEHYYAGYNTVRITGTFGPAAVPPSLKEIAIRIAVRDYQNRQAGEAEMTGSDDTGAFNVPLELKRRDYQTLDRFRLELSTFSWV